MVNRVWSLEEERIYWEEVIPKSPKRIGVYRSQQGYDWDVCAEMMQKSCGPNARRKYTGLSLFEHFFQNANRKRFSPNARQFVQRYLENCIESDLNGRLKRGRRNEIAKRRKTAVKATTATTTKNNNAIFELGDQAMNHRFGTTASGSHHGVKNPSVDSVSAAGSGLGPLDYATPDNTAFSGVIAHSSGQNNTASPLGVLAEASNLPELPGMRRRIDATSKKTQFSINSILNDGEGYGTAQDSTNDDDELFVSQASEYRY